MVSQNTAGRSRWKLLEQWRSTLFLVAGGLVAIAAMLFAVEVFTNTDVGVTRGFFAPAGVTFAFVGMLGLYPALVSRTPWLARAGALFVGAGIVATGVRAVVAASQLVGVLDAQPAWVDPFQLPLLIGIVLGFITFGVAVLRTDAYSRSVGVLLLVPGILFPTVLATIVTMRGDFPYVIHVLHNGADALALLGVGYLVRLDGRPTDRTEPVADTTAR